MCSEAEPKAGLKLPRPEQVRTRGSGLLESCERHHALVGVAHAEPRTGSSIAICVRVDGLNNRAVEQVERGSSDLQSETLMEHKLLRRPEIHIGIVRERKPGARQKID